MHSRQRIEDIRAAAKSRIRSLVRDLLPDPKGYFAGGSSSSGMYWFCRNPGRVDRNVGSFFVLLAGEAAGGWFDKATGEQGDVIDLVALSQGLNRGDAIAWLGRWTGIDQAGAKGLAVKRQQWADEAAASAEDQVAELAEQRRRAKGLWLAARRIERHDPPWRYFTEGRGIDLEAFIAAQGRLPSLVRWMPEHRHTESGLRLPAIICGICTPAGEVIGVHRTWLRSDGLDKSHVRPVRKVWPRGCAGGVVWVSRGGSKYGAVEAGRRGEAGVVIYGEGLEDVMTAAVAEPTARVGMVMSLGNLGRLTDVPWASGYVVLRDNDWGKPEALSQFDAAIVRMEAWGKPVEVVSSPVGKDFNDLAQRAMQGAI